MTIRNSNVASKNSKMRCHYKTMLIGTLLLLTTSSTAFITPTLRQSLLLTRTTTTSSSTTVSLSPETKTIPPFDMEETKKLCVERNIPFECIKNARDLASVRGSPIKPGRAYRLGKISDASASDLTKLDELDIRTVVDLRSPTEWKEDKKLNDEEVFGEYTTCIWKERNGKVKEGGVMEVSRRQRMKNKMDKSGTAATSAADIDESSRKERHFVSIMDEFKYVKGTITKLRKRDLAGVLLKAPGALFSRRVRTAVKSVFLDEINDGGLPMLNDLLMRMGKPGIKYVLELVADESRHPIAFYCTAGKDRTGMIAAIILAVAGVEEEAIVEDYGLSANVYAEINDHTAMVGALSQRNLDPETFLGAPPQVMRDTLEGVKENYGSMDAYLDWIGFEKGQREKLRKALLE